MATKKFHPSRHLEIVKDKAAKTDINAWNWRCVSSRNGNILYSAYGYNSRSSALKMAKRHNQCMKLEMEIRPV